VEGVFTKVPNYFPKNTKKESDFLLISIRNVTFWRGNLKVKAQEGFSRGDIFDLRFS